MPSDLWVGEGGHALALQDEVVEVGAGVVLLDHGRPGRHARSGELWPKLGGK